MEEIGNASRLSPNIPWTDLKRFSGYGRRSKLDTTVTIPHTLDVHNYMSKTAGDRHSTPGEHYYMYMCIKYIVCLGICTCMYGQWTLRNFTTTACQWMLLVSLHLWIYMMNNSPPLQSTSCTQYPTTLALCTLVTTQHGVNTTALTSGTHTTIASECTL